MRRSVFAALSAFLSLCLCTFAVLSLSSCQRQEKSEIVTEVESAEALGQICGFSPLTPDFSEVGELTPQAYRSLYGFVAETEYSGENGLSAIFRMADGGYNVSNLSGYTDMGLEDVYIYSDEIEFEILTREHVYACEWRGTVDGTEYQFSLTLTDGSLVDMRKLLRTIPTLCDSVENEKQHDNGNSIDASEGDMVVDERSDL